MTEKLKRCPFCGGEVAIHKIEKYSDTNNDKHYNYFVMCQKCNTASNIEFSSEAEAIFFWNTRSSTTNHADELKPCPFCGREAVILRADCTRLPYSIVGCEFCRVFCADEFEEKVIDKWNTRVDDD